MREKEIKKSGENGNLNFKYFELKDFLNDGLEILEGLNIYSEFYLDYENQKAVLSLCDLETDENKDFYFPIPHITLGGDLAMQQFGAINTYAKRYLFMNLFEIIENDKIEAKLNKTNAEEIRKHNKNNSAEMFKKYLIENLTEIKEKIGNKELLKDIDKKNIDKIDNKTLSLIYYELNSLKK